MPGCPATSPTIGDTCCAGPSKASLGTASSNAEVRRPCEDAIQSRQFVFLEPPRVGGQGCQVLPHRCCLFHLATVHYPRKIGETDKMPIFNDDALANPPRDFPELAKLQLSHPHVLCRHRPLVLTFHRGPP